MCAVIVSAALLQAVLPLARHLIKKIPILAHNQYSARRLMESRIIESAAYCNQILPAQLYIDRAQNTPVN